MYRAVAAVQAFGGGALTDVHVSFANKAKIDKLRTAARKKEYPEGKTWHGIMQLAVC